MKRKKNCKLKYFQNISRIIFIATFIIATFISKRKFLRDNLRKKSPKSGMKNLSSSGIW